jgi:REP element-mobilizing transposase RayT
MQFPNRKPNRLSDYDYSRNGAYFITICTKDSKCILSQIVEDTSVGDGVLDVPKIHLTKFGKIVNDRIIEMNNIYKNVSVEKYVVMPNHIHLLIVIDSYNESIYDGTSRTPSPTRQNSVISSFVSTFKRYTNKQIGYNIWQRSFHDHVIRDEEDYLTRWQYIDENPKKWLIGKDEYYSL